MLGRRSHLQGCSSANTTTSGILKKGHNKTRWIAHTAQHILYLDKDTTNCDTMQTNRHCCAGLKAHIPSTVMFHTKGATSSVDATAHVPHLPSSVTVSASVYDCGPASKFRFWKK